MREEKIELTWQERDFTIILGDVDGEISLFSSEEHSQLQAEQAALEASISTLENAVDSKMQAVQHLSSQLMKVRQEIRRGISTTADLAQLVGKFECDPCQCIIYDSLRLTRCYVSLFTAQHEDAKKALVGLETTVDDKKIELTTLLALMDAVAPLPVQDEFIELSAKKETLSANLKSLRRRLADLAAEEVSINLFVPALQSFISNHIPAGSLTIERYKDTNNNSG